jgi:predicted TIM-barrel enzyme
MAGAGADVLVAHMGLTTKGAIGARTAPTLDECVERVQAIRDAAPGPIVLCHGGPLAEPDDVRYLLTRTRGVAGFFGASAVERLPVEAAISRTVRDFKTIIDDL